MSRCLLFINGVPPQEFPNPADYDLVACTDGAFHYLKKQKFPLDSLNFISGDFDSYAFFSPHNIAVEVIDTPDQNKTDFHKALEILENRGITEVDVFGGSGGEQDHYLGNLTVAYVFRERLNIKFFDAYSSYFFIPNNFVLHGVRGKMISLVPFPIAEKVTTTGLNWPLRNETLDITYKIGTRNFATEDIFTCRYSGGGMLVFVGKNSKVGA